MKPSMEGGRTGRVFRNRSVSFPPDLLEQAADRAAELRLSFSAYVQRCVSAELEGRVLVVYRDELPERGEKVAEDPAEKGDRSGRKP